MVVVDVSFETEKKSKIASLISWKTFRDDREFLEVLEDHMFWKMMKESDKWDYVKEEDIFSVLDQNIWR